MKTSALLLLCLTFALAGCGTINTVLRGDEVTSRELLRQKSYCTTVPRIYSGMYYNFCVLNAPACEESSNVGYAMPGLFVDTLASGVLDTIALPYTLYRQNQDGSIEITRTRWEPAG